MYYIMQEFIYDKQFRKKEKIYRNNTLYKVSLEINKQYRISIVNDFMFLNIFVSIINTLSSIYEKIINNSIRLVTL